MTTAPFVELHVAPESISRSTEQFLTRPFTTEQAITNALISFRMFMIRESRYQLSGLKSFNPLVFESMINDLARVFMPYFSKATLPYIVASYAEGFAKAKAGNIPPQVLNSLAEEYAQRMGMYFHESSRDSLIQGFNTFVNKKVPQRLAAERVLEAYGLTSRQMGGYTSAVFEQKINSPLSLDLKRRVKDYVTKSLGQRFKIFAAQETHNLDQQAQQVAWNYLVTHDRLTERAQKVWLTEKDERVCPTCGPMHGKRAGVTEKFDNGLFVPGVHVNCRCSVRLVISPLQKDLYGPALAEFNEEHPRGHSGRFTTKQRTRAKLDLLDRPQIEFKPVGGDLDIGPSLDVDTDYAPGGGAADLDISPLDTPSVGLDVDAPAPQDVSPDLDVASQLDVQPDLDIEPSADLDIEASPSLDIEPTVTAKPARVKPKPDLGARHEVDLVLPQKEAYYKIQTYNPDTGLVMHFDGENFKADLDKVKDSYRYLRNQNIEWYLNAKTNDGRKSASFPWGSYSARLAPEEFRRLLEHNAEVQSEESVDPTKFNVDLYYPDEADDEYEDFDRFNFNPHAAEPIDSIEMSAKQVLDSMDIDPEEFKMIILKIDSIHDPEGGRGYHEYKDIHQNETIDLTGNYQKSEGLYVDQEDDYGSYRFPIQPVTPFDPAKGYLRPIPKKRDETE